MVADKLPTLLLVQNRSFASSMEDLVDRQILPERGLIGDSGGHCADRTPGQPTMGWPGVAALGYFFLDRG